MAGVGDQPAAALPPAAREALLHYVQVGSLQDEGAVLDAARHLPLDRVECLWEPYLLLAARVREAMGLPGLTVEQTVPFRDKERMKQRLDAAGIRTPWHATTTTAAGVRELAARIGYPVIVKPIAGAGSADTYRIDDDAGLEAALPLLAHVPEVSVEEFVDGEEFTYDTVCAGGRILFENISWYRPRPLIGRLNEWISQQIVALRDLDAEDLAGGRAMGRAVLAALGFQDGFTHMEWYRKADGEVVFGEIGARPPGARSVDTMNHACDADLYSGWAEALVRGRIDQDLTRRYNAAAVYKRAQGQGRIVAVDGLSRLLAEYGDGVVAVDLAAPGEPRRDWQASVIGDGRVVVRHPDLATTLEMADRFATELHLYAA